MAKAGSAVNTPNQTTNIREYELYLHRYEAEGRKIGGLVLASSGCSRREGEESGAVEEAMAAPATDNRLPGFE